MTIRDSRALRSAVADTLAGTPNEKRLVLLWAGVAAGLSLLTGLISYLLSSGIAGTGGLSGIGLRSILTTAQEILSTAATIALPFWTLGYQRTMLDISRRQPVSEKTLLSGFRRFGPGLRLMLLEGFLYGTVTVSVFYVSLRFLAMTPLADPVYVVLEPVIGAIMADPNVILEESLMAALADAMVPMMLVGGAICLAVLIPISYRLRLAQFRLMDDPACGAREAIRTSTRLTKGNCIALFKLDLCFWWFWLLQGLIMAISYGDSILGFLGIALPVSADVAFWGFYVAALAVQVVFYTAFHNRISAAYALFYDSLLPHPEAPAE